MHTGAGGHLPLLHVAQISLDGILQSDYQLACELLISCTGMAQMHELLLCMAARLLCVDSHWTCGWGKSTPV